MQTQRIPLVGKLGEVKGHATVDAADAPALLEQRWSLGGNGYALYQRYPGRVFYMHREILGLVQGDGRHVDHIDGDPLNNTRANLRVCEHRQNQQNRGYGYGSSRHRGVGWDKSRQRWVAKVKLDGRTVNLGRFKDESDAATAAARFRAEHMPFSSDAKEG